MQSRTSEGSDQGWRMSQHLPPGLPSHSPSGLCKLRANLVKTWINTFYKSVFEENLFTAKMVS